MSTDMRRVERLGTTDSGGYVVVEVKLSTPTDGREHETVTHGRVTDPTRLSVTGEHYEKGDRRGNPSSAGQIVGDLASISTPAPGWTLEEIAELRAIWTRWHLNDMRAECAHMDPATLAREDDGYGGQRISTRAPENVCPETGYQYGHSWLVEELPTEVIDRVRHLMRDRSQDLYRARGYDGSGKRVDSD